MLAIPMPEGMKTGLIEARRQISPEGLYTAALVSLRWYHLRQLLCEINPSSIGQYMAGSSSYRPDSAHRLQEIAQLAP